MSLLCVAPSLGSTIRDEPHHTLGAGLNRLLFSIVLLGQGFISFEKGYHYLFLPVLALNSQKSACLCLLKLKYAEIKGVCYYAKLSLI